jgi:hypothetical protein
MAKLCTVMMTEGSLRALIAILVVLRKRMISDGRVDLARTVDRILATLYPQEVTPVEV